MIRDRVPVWCLKACLAVVECLSFAASYRRSLEWPEEEDDFFRMSDEERRRTSRYVLGTTNDATLAPWRKNDH